jgi:hypothetical protein
MTARSIWMNLGWLVALIATIAAALLLDAVQQLRYFTSLVLWVIPIAYLVPLFLTVTAEGSGRRRRALTWTIGTIVVLGIVLDFLLGRFALRFMDCPPLSSAYLYCFASPFGGSVPIEEVLFYATGPAAITLVYACSDERWLSAYNPKDDLLHARLLQISPTLVITAIIAGVALLVIWQATGHFPAYAAFLVAGALLPAMFFYRCINTLVNWPAFAVTTLYVALTSVIWEATLAIPRGWWGYQPNGMIGVTIGAWSSSYSPFPIEAAFVWVAAPFSSVLFYEFAKALTHHPLPTRQALFGAQGL